MSLLPLGVRKFLDLLARLETVTGIHHEQWTQEESEQYLINNSAFRRSLCQSAVRDIIERPGARCAPALGLAQILELRSQAEVALGPAFNAGAFHRALLLRSPLPIGPLRSRMAEWIESALGKR